MKTMNNLSIEEQKNIFGGSEVGRGICYYLGKAIGWLTKPSSDVRMSETLMNCI